MKRRMWYDREEKLEKQVEHLKGQITGLKWVIDHYDMVDPNEQPGGGEEGGEEEEE